MQPKVNKGGDWEVLDFLADNGWHNAACMGTKVSEGSDGHQTCTVILCTLTCTFYLLIFLTWIVMTSEGRELVAVVFCCCFCFYLHSSRSENNMNKKRIFPICRNKMQPCGSQHTNKCQHVWNAVPVVIKTHKQLQNNFVACYLHGKACRHF